MSRDPIDKWLDALQFENYRLSFKPHLIHAEILESQIREMESLPLDKIAGDDLDAALKRLESLKQDLASTQQLLGLAAQLRNVRDQISEKGIFNYNPEDANEILNDFHAWFEKSKIEQRERQWRNLASLKHFWPQADGARRRRMVELFATYARRRLTWGIGNFKMTIPLRIGRWAGRMYMRGK